MDRASIHTSSALWERLEEWRERDLHIFEFPSYSPELNLIEILWRFIKYEWIEIDAYSSWQSLVSAVDRGHDRYAQKFGRDRAIADSRTDRRKYNPIELNTDRE